MFGMVVAVLFVPMERYPLFKILFFLSIITLPLLGEADSHPVWAATDAPAFHTLSPTEFTLGPGDELKVTVWGYPELSEQVAVLPDGTISYPMIGSLPAAGLTAEKFAQALQQSLGTYVESPQISIVVTTMRSRHFSVMGEVGRSGVYPLWNEETTVLEAIAEAGGLGSTPLLSDAKIFRSGGEEVIPVDLDVLLSGQNASRMPTVQPGDVVYVPSVVSRRQISVLGEVNLPGLYTLKPEMTVIDALGAAGWIRSSGVSTGVWVLRRGPDEERRMFKINAQRAVLKQDASQELRLEPGDVIFVPQGFLSKVSQFVGLFTSGVEPAARTYLKVYDATEPANVVVER